MKKLVIFFLAVVLLSFLSFHKAFSFAFIVDDWFQLWGAMFERTMLSNYFSDHPNVALELLFLSKFFSFNPFYYYLVSFFLKITCSLTVSLFVYGLIKSNKASLFAGLIFASSVMGLEAFSRISAHYAVFSIILLSLGMYFWVLQINKNFFRNTVVSVTAIILALLGDPGSSIMVLPLIIMWDIFSFYQNHLHKKDLKLYLVRVSLIILVLILVYFILRIRAQHFTSSFYSEQIQFAITHPISSLNNYLNSIGHLLIGWTIPVDEMLGLSNTTIIGTVAGYSLLVTIIISLMVFVKTRKNTHKTILFLLSWILVFYFPSWITQGHIVIGHLVIGVTNRYLAVSSIAVVVFLAVSISKIKSFSLRSILFAYVIAANIFTANVLLSKEQEYRSVKVQDTLYNKIDTEVAKGSERNSIFVFLGNSWFKVFAIDWNGAYPFALKRGIKKIDEFPLMLNNLQDVVNRLCQENSRYNLSNVYAWTVNNKDMINVSEQFREKVRTISCLI